MRILFATTNPHKFAEVSPVLTQELPAHELLSLRDFPDAPDFEESQESFREIAKAKALFYSQWLKRVVVEPFYVLAEDAGLEVRLLGGFPGVVSKRIGKTDAERISILLEKLAHAESQDAPKKIQSLPPPEEKVPHGISNSSRSAMFVCAMAVAKDEEILHCVEGKVHGFITYEPIGDGGFGYDPVFYYPPLRKTFGECSREEKIQVSHRANALRQIILFLKKELVHKIHQEKEI